MKVKSMLNQGAAISVLFMASTATLSYAQDQPVKHMPSLTIGVSAIKFTGDVGKQTDVSPLLDTRFGYYLAIEQRFGKILGVSIGGMYGKMAGTDNTKNSHLNFESKIIQGELLLTANFDKIMKNDPSVSPFINAGIGYMMFDPYGDIKKGDSLYHYWTDGSIRNQTETGTNQLTASVVRRDYSYETQLKDSATNYTRATLVVPVGGGINFHIGERWVASIGANYMICLSDYVDNYKKGGNDSYVQANVGIQYEFRKKAKSTTEEIDFNEVDQIDNDGDGVGDHKDRCLGTPRGVLVDSHGCPFDTDEDGVADYLDKEPKSKKGAKVDGYGMTINESEMAKHQLEWDAIAEERSDKFNEAPSLGYLKEVENKSKATTKANANTIPADLRSADINADGYISADEITKTIDAFFEGTNDFTVDMINQLIDYFFEQ
ncbi:MAG: hypothetical protein K0S33_2121 [Bacteroidetes bacterium]|jgi:hypothetical protein|nr:hypothetical protein [Bacteroidota bacterium]